MRTTCGQLRGADKLRPTRLADWTGRGRVVAFVREAHCFKRRRAAILTSRSALGGGPSPIECALEDAAA